MITLQKLLNELKPESLNEIVGGSHGKTNTKTKTRGKTKTKTRTRTKGHTRYY